MTFAMMLKTARKDMGLSQKAVACKIGCGEMTYKDWEHGRLPKPGKVSDIAEALCIGPQELNEAYLAEMHSPIYEQKGVMCGDCTEFWVADKSRNKYDGLLYGRCMRSGVRTERCDWCREWEAGRSPGVVVTIEECGRGEEGQ